MEFSCERCHTSQTIADAGAEGAVARCQHCGHVNQVAAGGAGRAAPAAGKPEPDLEEEIGAAFDSMFGEGAPSSAGAASDAAGAPASAVVDSSSPDLGSASSPSEGPDADPAGFEWYVAIDGKQVGPVSFADLKERWARSIIGPDSLCWRMHFPDWLPIADVPSLVEALGASPQAPRGEASTGSRDGLAAIASGFDGESELDAGAGHTQADPADASVRDGASREDEARAGFQPTAASDLSALVQDELDLAKQREAEAADDPRSGIPDPETTGVRVLIRNLPEAPKPEPTNFIPTPRSVPAPVERDRTKAPAPAASGRPTITGASKPKSSGKGVAVAALVVLLLGGGAAGAYFTGLLEPLLGGGAGPMARGEPLAASPARAQEEAPATKQELIPQEQGEPEAVAAKEGEAAEDALAKADADAGAAAEADLDGDADDAAAADAASTATATATPTEAAKAPQVAKAPAPKPAPTKSGTARQAPVPAPAPRAQAAPRPKAPPPPTTQAKAPAAPTPARGGDLLAAGKSNSIDALFEQEMAAPAPVRKEASGGTYIPPPPGAGSQKPRSLGQGDIMGVVAAQKADLRTCANRYKEQGGTTGSVVMSWAIEPNGRTSAIRAVRGQEHAPMVGCLTGLIKDWRFPEYAGPKMAPIEFPFQF